MQCGSPNPQHATPPPTLVIPNIDAHTTVAAVETDHENNTCGQERKHSVIKNKKLGGMPGMTRQSALHKSMTKYSDIVKSDNLQRDVQTAKSRSRINADEAIPIDVRLYVVDPAVCTFAKNMGKVGRYTVKPATPPAVDIACGALRSFVCERRGARDRFGGTKHWVPEKWYPWGVDFYSPAVVTAW